MTQTREEMLESAVLGLFIQPKGTNRPSVFLSSLYCSLTQQWDDSIPTACVDSRMRLRINADWFGTLSPRMRETLIAHELWHIALLHVDEVRAAGRCPDKWNEACDHAINLMLLEHGFTFDKYPVGHPRAGEIIGLADARFTGMTAEEIYEILEAEGGPPMDLPFGKDFEVGSPGDAAGDSTGEGKGAPGNPTPMTDAQRAQLTSAVVRAATLSQMSGREAGALPGQLATLIDELLNPRLPWEQLLRRWLSERSSFGSTWRRPSRRYGDIYMPGRAGQEGLAHLRWYLDCSGSVTDEQLKVYNSEVAGAKSTHNPELMTVSSFDTELRDTWVFTEDQDLMGLEFHGRGGTCLLDVMKDIRKHKPSAAIIISDLECHIPPSPGIPILWICVDNPKRTVPYGHIVHLDSKL